MEKPSGTGQQQFLSDAGIGVILLPPTPGRWHLCPGRHENMTPD